MTGADVGSALAAAERGATPTPDQALALAECDDLGRLSAIAFRMFRLCGASRARKGTESLDGPTGGPIVVGQGLVVLKGEG